MLPGSPCLAALQAHFGADILDETGALRRRLLADRAFATPEGTRLLTELTQPEILRRIEADLQCAQAAGAELAFVDGAVIVGSPFQARCDELVLITARMKSACSASARGTASRRRWRAAAWTPKHHWSSCAPRRRSRSQTTARRSSCKRASGNCCRP